MSTFTASGTHVSDSPVKPNRGNHAHTNTRFDNNENKAELRYKMHRKTILIEHCRFMQFFKCPQRSFPDIFNKITSTPANESEMYDTLVCRLPQI